MIPFDPTLLLRPLARRWVGRLDAQEPVAAQARLLRHLLARAADTRFGRDHGFAHLDGVEDFQRAVPLRPYEQMWQEYWEAAFPHLQGVSWPAPVPFFAQSSGTSAGRTKYLPVTTAMVQANARGALQLMARHLCLHPQSRPFAGPNFLLGGSTDLQQLAPGVRAGDLSGIAAATIPALARPWNFPPQQIALIPEWDRKLAILAERAPAETRSLSGTPSWLLVLLEALAARRGHPPLPHLELLVHGGTAWAPYRERLRPYLPTGCATREAYAASEGFLAMADRGDGEGLRLNLDAGLFYEFVPLEELSQARPRRHWVATVEPGVDYAVVLSSVAGLFGHVLGDTVRFLNRTPPRLLITGRTAYSLSAFGEHLSGEEIEQALLGAVRAVGGSVAEYTVGPVFQGSRGRHEWLVELAAPPPGQAAPTPHEPTSNSLTKTLAQAVDAALMAANADYQAHREGGQLEPPRLELLPPGSFARWLRANGKLGGQHKVPRVVPDAGRFAAIAAFLHPPVQ